MKLTVDLFKTKLGEVKKILWILGSYAFSFILLFVLIDLILGTAVFYKYVFLAETKAPQITGQILKFDEATYQKVLEKLQTNQKGMGSLIVTEKPTIANPASVNCTKQGGNLIIKNKEDGSQYSLCYFDDNRACEEWAMIRGECPVGGVKTTGFDTVAQSFCAWSGGQTFAVENAVCTFDDGSTCLAEEFYQGNCQKGEIK
jgi:hypothetical protein